MQLVLLTLQVAEESSYPHELCVAIEHQIAMLLRQIDPRHVQRNSCLLRIALQIRLQRTIFRLRPRFNRSLGQSLQFVGNPEIEIKINRVPKSLAAWASTIRIVEREHPRLRLLIPQVAELAL